MKNDINQLSEKEQIELIEKSPLNIILIKHPTEKIQKIIVDKNPSNIFFIEHPSVDIQEYATDKIDDISILQKLRKRISDNKITPNALDHIDDKLAVLEVMKS